MPSDPAPAIPDPARAARAAGLRYVSDDEPGLTRRRSGTGFGYRDPDGAPVRDKATLARLRALAIPPAYEQVWICRDARGHIQATGRDEKGRKQYRYHADWRAIRDAAKYEHVLDFAQGLPDIRRRVEADLRRPGLPREKVLATVVRLLERTLIRVGNEDYAESNGSYGLTTLRNRHVATEGPALRFHFRGKSGKTWNLHLDDRRVARVVRDCQDLPGQRLFGYRDADGAVHEIDSADVNAYLRGITGRDITAKDFRTWAGTVLAAAALRGLERFDGQVAGKRNITRAIEAVAARLGNTPTICRQCYIHPGVLDHYLSGAALPEVAQQAGAALRDEKGLSEEETTVLALLTGLREPRGKRRPGAKQTGERARAG